MKKTDVEEKIMKEILKSCSLYERSIVRIFNKEFVKIYKKGFQDGFNWNNKEIENFQNNMYNIKKCVYFVYNVVIFNIADGTL